MSNANSQEILKETVFQLLSHNQKIDDLLLEVKSIPCKNEDFMGHLAGAVCTPLLVTCDAPRQMSSHQATDMSLQRLLAAESMEDILVTLHIIKKLQQDGSFDMSCFHGNLCRQPELSARLLWMLHKEGLLTFDKFIRKSLLKMEKTVSFACQLFREYLDEHNGESIQGLLCECIQLGYGETQGIYSTSRESAVTLLDTFITCVVDHVLGAPREDGLNVSLVTNTSLTEQTCLKKCFSHLLTLLLTYKPELKVSQAIQEQHNWAFGKIPAGLVSLYKELLLPFEVGEALLLLQQVMEQQEVNWRLLLSFVSVTVVCLPECANTLLGFVDSLLTEGLEDCDIETSIMGMLLARQACFQGQHVFMAYADWFQRTFSDSHKSLAGSRKSFTFLMKFLTNLMPFETAQHLKAHIIRQPYVPARCRQLISDYILLAKTRLHDLKENVDLLDDGSTTKDASKDSSSKLSTDVEGAVVQYANSGKIPTSVMEASIFKKPYYVGQFLPTLLKPRPLPDFPDARMKLIAALRNGDKIPVNMYTNYERECKREAQNLLQGVVLDSDSGDEMELSPFELLENGLQQLAQLVGGGKIRFTDNELISVICERLESVLSVKPHSDVRVRHIISLDSENIAINSEHLKVMDLILNSMSGCLQTAYKSPHPTLTWLSQLLQGLGQYDVVMETLYKRVWTLLHTQKDTLEQHHIDCLSASLMETLLLGNQLSWIQMQCCGDLPQQNQPECLAIAIMDRLQMRTAGELTFALRLCSSCLKYVLCSRSSLNDVECCSALIKKFSYLAMRQYSSLRHSTTTVQPVSPDTEGEDLVRVIYTSDQFQTLAQCIQLTPDVWLEYEIQIADDDHCTTCIDRHAYHRWMVYDYFMQQTGCDECYTYRSIASCLLLVLVNSEQRGEDSRRHSGKCEPGGGRTFARSRYLLVSLLQELCYHLSIEEDTAELPWLHEQLMVLLQTCIDSIHKQAVTHAFFRLAVCLPSHLLYSDRPSSMVNPSEVESSMAAISNTLVRTLSEGLYLPAYITVYLVQGVLEASSRHSRAAIFHHLCSAYPVLNLSILVHTNAVWSVLSQHQDLKEVAVIQVVEFLRDGCYDGLNEQEPWLHAACLFSVVLRGQRPDIQPQLQTSSTMVLEKVAEMLMCQLAFEHNLTNIERSAHTERLSQAVMQVVSAGDRHVLQHVLGGDVDLKTVACCTSAVLHLRHLALLRCLATNQDKLPRETFHSASLLNSLLSAFKQVNQCLLGEDIQDKYQDCLLVSGLGVSKYVTSVVLSTPADILHQLDQELVLECGPAVTEAAFRGMST